MMGATKGQPMQYRVQLIPLAATARTGRKLLGGRATSITVHNTANPNATADGHADWLTRDLTAGVSPHIFVDDKEAVRVLPLTEQGWHAGTDAGNTTSVGIEVCEFSDRARQDKADDNAQRLIADMLTGKAPAGWNLTHLALKDVRTHQSWSGKYCPRKILPWWDRFIAETRALMQPSAPVPLPVEYRAVIGWSENAASLEILRDLADGLHVRMVTDGPAFYAHASLDKAKALEAQVAWDKRLHRMNALPVAQHVYQMMGVADGIGEATWQVDVG